jgi:FlaA1/EpsC-like NDP-sugar epimerase
VGSFLLATLVRFEGDIPATYSNLVPQFLLLIAVARVAANFLFRLHRWSFRLSGLPDGFRVVLAGLLGTGLFLTLAFLLRIGFVDAGDFGFRLGPPRSVVILDFFIATAAMGLMRFSPRLAWLYLADRKRSRAGAARRSIIIGAGAAGDALLRDLERSDKHELRVVAFVDDDRSKWGTIIGGKPVLGGVDDLPELAERFRIDTVLIAVPRLPAQRIREILSLCSDLKVRFKILPLSFLYLNDKAPLSMLQDLAPEDLLPRTAVELTPTGEFAAMEKRRALVTGAAGSIGSEICRQVLKAGVGQLVMVDINENLLYLGGREYEASWPHSEVHIEVGDVRDAERMNDLFRRYRPNDVFHAAAHKHVPLMEAAPCEAVKNNVLGTRNVALAADAFSAERFVFISTDKAVRPNSVMGATKRVGESLVWHMAPDSRTKFCAVRFGNVLGSSGSVVPLFRQQIANGGPVTVTDPEVRRYFMTVSEAVGLVLKAAYGDYGSLCVLDMGEQMKIVDLARHMIVMAGLAPDIDVPIVFTGLRPGEKLFEELMTEDEERTARVDDKILVVESSTRPSDLNGKLDTLIGAAQAQDHVRVREILRDLVPSYLPQRESTSSEGEVASA